MGAASSFFKLKDVWDLKREEKKGG